MRKSIFVGLVVAGALSASFWLSAPASAGRYCGSGYYGYYGYYAPTTDSYWAYRRYYQPTYYYQPTNYYGAAYYAPAVWGWRSWGEPQWGYRAGWRRW